MKNHLLLLLFGSSLFASGQAGDVSAGPVDEPSPSGHNRTLTIKINQPDELKQELDADALALSKAGAGKSAEGELLPGMWCRYSSKNSSQQETGGL